MFGIVPILSEATNFDRPAYVRFYPFVLGAPSTLLRSKVWSKGFMIIRVWPSPAHSLPQLFYPIEQPTLALYIERCLPMA